MIATLLVGLFTKSFVVLGLFFAASLATSVIGMISVFSIVIMVSPNHSTSSNIIPKEMKLFQENIKVSEPNIISSIDCNLALLLLYSTWHPH